jgi:hypothetical protein
MKSVTGKLIFRRSGFSELATTGFSNRADHGLGHRLLAVPFLQLIETGQQRLAEHHMILEFGSRRRKMRRMEGRNSSRRVDANQCGRKLDSGTRSAVGSPFSV